MHKYIDYKKLRNFDKKMTFDKIHRSLALTYEVTNIDFDDFDPVYFVVNLLLEDYVFKRANYLAYIEKGIDARVLLELRRNALLKFDDDEMKIFCKEHNTLNTQEEIKNLRIKYIQKYLPEYVDYDWQYALLIKKLWGLDIMEFYFDGEVCFEDRKTDIQRVPEDYKREFNNFIFDSLNRNFGLNLKCPD